MSNEEIEKRLLGIYKNLKLNIATTLDEPQSDQKVKMLKILEELIKEQFSNENTSRTIS